MSYDHDEIADSLAKKFGTKHRPKGVDIVFKDRSMEVAVTEEDLRQSVGQLKRSRAERKYMVVPTPLIPKAREILEDTGIGIMNTRGTIKKRSRKKRS